MNTISPSTQQLIQRHQLWYQSLLPEEGVSTIHVDEIASRVAAFYEKIKGVVDWKEEHLLRKRAIERILKRRIIFQKENGNMAESLVYELIRGGYFPNDSIPESKIVKTQKILNKYLFILAKTRKEKPADATNEPIIELQDWLLDIASYELEKTLSPPLKEEALVDYMADLMKERIKVSEEIITEDKKNIQVYIAVQRALFNLDESTIAYCILCKRYPEWRDFSLTTPLFLKIAENIYAVKESIVKELNHPLSEKFFNICKKHNTPYLILGDIVAKNPLEAQENLENPEILEGLIKESYSQRLIKLKTRLRRAAIYSTISIFVTKITLALAIEIPIDKYIMNEFNSLSLGINILFPVFLMFLLVVTIKPPKKENLERVIMEVSKICYQKERKDIYEIRKPKKRGKILGTIIFSIYALAFLISFGIIIKALQGLNFGIFSMAIFIFFVSVISFLGVKIRERSKELTVEEEKETFVHSLFDLFSLPIVRMGRWFSEKWAKLNIALIISALIDMPFLTFVEFLEQWQYFLKEKKEEIH